jgi:hypothetical protein
VYALMIPFWIALVVWCARRWYGAGLEANFAVGAFLITPGFLRLLGEGHDILAISFAMVLLIFLVDHYSKRPGALVWIAVLSGVIATSRVIFLPLSLALAFLLFTRDRRQAIRFAVIGAATTLLIHLPFWLSTSPYPPLHLFTRADQRQPTWWVVVSLAATIVVVIIVIKRIDRPLPTWLACFAALLAVPTAAIGFGELISKHQLASWEGANYVLTAVAVSYAAAVTLLFRDRIGRRYSMGTTPHEREVTAA